MHAEAPVKQKVTRVAEVQANTVVETVNELIGKALVYTQTHTFPQVYTKSVTDRLTCYYSGDKSNYSTECDG